ncbi:hypothetical protein COOONC_12917 [Cooperia oncophora]
MDETSELSPINRSISVAELVRPVKEEESDITPSAADECSHRKNCLYAALRAISLNMLVNPEAGNFGKRYVLTPETKTIISNVKQFFVTLKEHLGPDVRGTIFSSVTAITATACAVSDTTVARASSSRPRQTKTQRSSEEHFGSFLVLCLFS